MCLNYFINIEVHLFSLFLHYGSDLCTEYINIVKIN